MNVTNTTTSHLRLTACWFRFSLRFCVFVQVYVPFCVFFCIILDHFIPVLLAFVVLGLVSSVPSQEIGWEERL